MPVARVDAAYRYAEQMQPVTDEEQRALHRLTYRLAVSINDRGTFWWKNAVLEPLSPPVAPAATTANMHMDGAPILMVRGCTVDS